MSGRVRAYGHAPAYRHTQRARLVAGGVAAFAVLVCAVAVSRASGAPAGAWLAVSGVLVVVGCAAVVFSALTVEVDDRALRWHFAFGVLRRAVPRAEIAGAEATATTLLDGIGIHVGPRGWVYNVALGPAVRVLRRDGGSFVLGTDDPGGLVAALGASRE